MHSTHMQHQNSLVLQQSALLIIDMQEAFRASISDFEQIARRTAVMGLVK
jgi:hypothetical protein